MSLLVVYNPACGHGTAKSLFSENVLPLLQERGRNPIQVVETTHKGHAEGVLLQFLKDKKEPISVILGSGDGTLHEMLCALRESSPPELGKVNITFALVPCGTANALYSSLFPPSAEDLLDSIAYKLRAVESLLSSSPSIRPLDLALTSFFSPSDDTLEHTSLSAVVTSTALHASILHDSEALRATHPGIERFKIAAQQNATRWYEARVKLLPLSSPSDPSVKRYDQNTDSFVPYSIIEEGTGVVELTGPFSYFLSTVNVDRLEPAFRITPLHTALPPDPAIPSLDVVIIRPLRDHSMIEDSDHDREQFAKKCMRVMTGAYQDGAHVRMAYGGNGEIVEGDGTTIVEYFRCGGWEWTPDVKDDAAHLVCSDGEILHIKRSGRALCKATNVLDGFHLSVYTS